MPIEQKRKYLQLLHPRSYKNYHNKREKPENVTIPQHTNSQNEVRYNSTTSFVDFKSIYKIIKHRVKVGDI